MILRVFAVDAQQKQQCPIPIGRQGENAVTQVRFDLSAWLKLFGAGSVQLVHQRAFDPEPYPCSIDVDGGIATWTVSSADTAARGYGQAELRWSSNGKILKTQTFKTVCIAALSGDAATPPEPWQSWVDQVLDAADSIHAIPAGGTAGQVLGKASDGDFDYAWIDQTGGGGGGGSTWNTLPGKPFTSIGEGLKVVSGALTVDTAANVEQDNTKPITSAAVYTEVGNISALLSII